MKKQYFLVIDVETANSTDDPMVYDVGFAIADRQGKVYEAYSYIVSDVFDPDSELMKTAYYSEKIPKYLEGIKKKFFIVRSFYEVRQEIIGLLKKYDAKVCAYNAAFDTRALNTTQRYLTKSKYRYFLPYNTTVYCIWNMACQVICTQKNYNKFCLKNGFVSQKGNISTSAETVFAYINNDKNFKESHTGLQDVLIEVQILAHCYRQHKKMEKVINRCCWKIPQKVHNSNTKRE